MAIQKVNQFFRPLLTLSRNGDGNGDGDGDGDGDGYGNGNGDGDGYGNGNGYGYGDGDGYGYGYGDGNGGGGGYGYGYGYGDGYGDGDGDGDSYGYGYGNGIKLFNKIPVHFIDKLQTIITNIKNDIAKGFILQSDLTLKSCYIVRNDYYYSHGATLKEALKSLEEKTLLNLPIKKRIENFKNHFKNYNLKYKGNKFYDWHFKLTGSCKMGRDNFVKSNNLDLKAKYSVNEFIELTKNQYGGDIIKQLIKK